MQNYLHDCVHNIHSLSHECRDIHGTLLWKPVHKVLQCQQLWENKAYFMTCYNIHFSLRCFYITSFKLQYNDSP